MRRSKPARFDRMSHRPVSVRSMVDEREVVQNQGRSCRLDERPIHWSKRDLPPPLLTLIARSTTRDSDL